MSEEQKKLSDEELENTRWSASQRNIPPNPDLVRMAQGLGMTIPPSVLETLNAIKTRQPLDRRESKPSSFDWPPYIPHRDWPEETKDKFLGDLGVVHVIKGGAEHDKGLADGGANRISYDHLGSRMNMGVNHKLLSTGYVGKPKEGHYKCFISLPDHPESLVPLEGVFGMAARNTCSSDLFVEFFYKGEYERNEEAILQDTIGMAIHNAMKTIEGFYSPSYLVDYAAKQGTMFPFLFDFYFMHDVVGEPFKTFVVNGVEIMGGSLERGTEERLDKTFVPPHEDMLFGTCKCITRIRRRMRKKEEEVVVGEAKV